ncbi:MAG: hypothetical protein WC517_04460 [Patescibacteria group bacterium]
MRWTDDDMDNDGTKASKESVKEIDWAYYHLIALEYVESKFEAARQETSKLADAANKDPEKFRRAYRRLMYITDKAQKLIREHADKAMEHMEKTLPEERRRKTQAKRKAENKCYERIFIIKPEIEYDAEFTAADKLK